MNKIIFCTYPDMIPNKKSVGLVNANNTHIKELLNNFDNDMVFYVINDNEPNEWLNKIKKQSKIILDVNKNSIKEIKTLCQNI